MRPETKKYLHEIMRILAHASTMGAAMVFSTFAGVWFGYWLDTDVFHGKTHPWLTIIFFLFGLAGGIRNLLLLSNRLKRKTEEWSREEKEKTMERAEERAEEQRKWRQLPPEARDDWDED